MATFTATAAQANAAAIMNLTGVTTRLVRYVHPVALSAGDVLQLCRIPSGAVISEIALAVSSSAGAITGNLGDGNDTSAYAASVVLSGSAIVLTTIAARGLGRSYSAEDTVDFVVTALSAVPGTVELILKVEYTMQP